MTSDQAAIFGLIVMLTPVILLSTYVVYDYYKSEKKQKKSQFYLLLSINPLKELTCSEKA